MSGEFEEKIEEIKQRTVGTNLWDEWESQYGNIPREYALPWRNLSEEEVEQVLAEEKTLDEVR